MSEGRPNLRAVPGEKAAEAPRPAPRHGASGRGRVLLAVLLLAALVCAVGWALQARETGRVRSALEANRERLARVEARLAAREALLEGARERSAALVDEAAGLAERLRELSGFLAEGEEGAGEGAEARGPQGSGPAGDDDVAPPGVAPF